jgi:hypothetical protein
MNALRLRETKSSQWSVAYNHVFNKLPEPPKEKAKLLKPEEIPEVILDTDGDKLEADNNETTEEEQDYRIM